MHDLCWKVRAFRLCIPWCTMHMQSEKRRVTSKNKQSRLFSGMVHAGKAVSMGSVYLDSHAEWEVQGSDDVYDKTSYFWEWSMLSSSVYLDAHAEWKGEGWRRKIMQNWSFSCMIYAGRSVSMGSVYILMQRGRRRRSIQQTTGYFPSWPLFEGPCLWRALCVPLMHMQNEKCRVATRYTTKLVIFGNDLC